MAACMQGLQKRYSQILRLTFHTACKPLVVSKFRDLYMLPTTLVLIGSGLVFFLGLAHLFLTYFSRAFYPRDRRIEEAMKTDHPVITRQTTLWRGQIGFHASHSLGAMIFGLVYGYLALRHSDLLLQSRFLMSVGTISLLMYLVLAKLYWFIVPLVGIGVAFGCFACAFSMVYA